MSLSKRTIFSAIMFSAILLGCDYNRAEATSPSPAAVNINSLPSIMGGVAGVVPELNQNNSETVFNNVCRVAYGEIKPAEFRDEISQSGAAKGKEDAFTKLVQSNDIKPYQTVCAAYMIQSAGTIPDVNQYVTQQKDTAGQPVIKANEEAVINLMPFRLAVLRATAELYARIAVSLPEEKAQSVEIYNQKISRLFTQSAEDYLETVRKYNKEEMNNRYQLLLLQKGRFTFKSENGYVLDISPEGVNLYLYGTPWLGNGYIFGVVHHIDITLK